MTRQPIQPFLPFATPQSPVNSRLSATNNQVTARFSPGGLPRYVGLPGRRVRQFALLFCLTGVLFSQSLPDATTVLRQVAESWQKHQSYQFVSEINIEMTIADKPMRMTTTSTVAAIPPDRLRVESKSSLGPGVTIISDGAFTYMYLAVLRQYTKQAALSHPSNWLASIGAGKMPDTTKVVQVAKVLREESIDVDGTPRPCWVLEMKVDKLPLPAPPGAEMTDTVMIIWIDQEWKMMTRMTMAGTMQDGPLRGELKQDMRLHSIRFNLPLADSLFTFVPPEGAKQVEAFAGPGAKKPELVGKPAPHLQLRSLEGKPLSSAQLQGKTLLLDFWTTWCEPCRKEMPVLERLHQKFREAGLVLVGVNVGEDRAAVEDYLKTQAVSYPIALSLDSEIVSVFQVTAFPTHVLIAADGTIAAYEVGSGGEESLRALLRKAGLPRAKP